MNVATTRAIVRIARRDIGRSRWRSALVVLLVLLPVGAMVGAATVMQTVTPTAERSVTHRMGRADLHASAYEGTPTTASLREQLPDGSQVEAVTSKEGRVVLPGMQARVNTRSLDPSGLAAGMVAIVDGHAPAGPDEVAVSAQLARLAAVGIGGSIELVDTGARRVVGIVEDEFNLKVLLVLEHPSVAAAAGELGQAQWLVGLAPGAEVGDLRGFDASTRQDARVEAESVGPTIIVLGGLALVEAALVASAAFALSIRRRQRELGLLAATGAEPRHLAGTVLAGALLLGGAGALLGVVTGLVGAFVASPFLDGLTDRRNPPVVPEVGLILTAAVIGLLAAIIAAVVPAWTAGRLPVLTALSGRRPASAPASRTLLAGIVLVGLGVGMTAAGALLRRSDPSSVSLLLMLAGAVVGTLGFGACSPWLLERLEGPASHLPLASRIALRDTARARSRNGPIVSALLASFAATVALAAYLASDDAITARQWQPWLHPDQITVRGDGVGLAGPEIARDLGAIASGPVPGAGDDQRNLWLAPAEDDDVNHAYYFLTVGDAELLRALGAEAAIPDLEAGSVVLLLPEARDTRRVAIHVMDAAGVEVDRVELPAVVLANGLPPGELPQAIFSPAVAADLGVGPGRNEGFVVRLDHPVTEADLARAAALAAQYPGTDVDSARAARPPGEAFRTLVLLGSLLFALSVTGVAVALGEAESRPEQRTMLAVGADPRVRRRIAAARAAVISALAGVLAVPAGLLPAWGLLITRDAPLVVPIPEIVVSLAVLPLLATLGTFVLSRPIPTWSTFRTAGS